MNEEFAEHPLDIERERWINDAVFYKDNLTEGCALVFPENWRH